MDPRIDLDPAPMVADLASTIEKGQVIGIVAGADVLGFMVCFLRPTSRFVENVAVDPPTAQEHGLGRLLLDHADALANTADRDRLEVYTNAQLTENLLLYSRLGWREADRRVEDGFDRVCFEKRPDP